MAQMVFEAIEQAGRNFIQSLADLLPRAVITLSIVVVGWFIAIVVKWLTRWGLSRLRFNELCERLGVAALLKTADLPPAEALASRIVFWIVWVGFLLSGVDVLGFAALQGLVAGFRVFVPRLLVAIVILVVGFVFANFAWRATLLAAVNAKVPSPRVLSGAVRALVLILAAAMALDQIALARTIVLTAFAIAFGAAMLGLAIAFGVGGGGIARRILDHWFPERTDTRSDADDLRHL
jgi:hypothetical protein